jgi:hypothetical protein
MQSDVFNNYTYDMGYSYSSGSNDSEPQSQYDRHQPIPSPPLLMHDDWTFSLPSSYGTETSFWGPPVGPLDDVNSCWSAGIPAWQTPMTVRGASFGAGFSDTGFKFNPSTETQPHNAGSLEEEMMATSPSEPPSLPSASPPEK